VVAAIVKKKTHGERFEMKAPGVVVRPPQPLMTTQRGGESLNHRRGVSSAGITEQALPILNLSRNPSFTSSIQRPIIQPYKVHFYSLFASPCAED
jgi:hypothetical protein